MTLPPHCEIQNRSFCFSRASVLLSPKWGQGHLLHGADDREDASENTCRKRQLLLRSSKTSLGWGSGWIPSLASLSRSDERHRQARPTKPTLCDVFFLHVPADVECSGRL